MDISFGQKDLKGFFTVLVNNELIATRKITVNDQKQISYSVTHCQFKCIKRAAFVYIKPAHNYVSCFGFLPLIASLVARPKIIIFPFCSIVTIIY